MKKFLFPIISIARPLLPLKALIAISGERIVLPFYHAISDSAPPHLKELNTYKSVREFENDLDYLLRNFNPLTMEELINMTAAPPKPSFHLSFDDGLCEIYDIVSPILKRKGVPATFFVNPDFVDNKELFYRYKASTLIHFADSFDKSNWKFFHEYCSQENLPGKSLKEVCLLISYKNKHHLDEIAEIMGFSFEWYLKEFKPYLNNAHLTELASAGFTIGSHSMDHPEYWNLNGKEMLHQTLQSANWIKERYHQKYSVFAFPFSDNAVGRDFFHALGYNGKPLIDMSFGTAGIKREQFRLHRQRIPLEDYKLKASSVIFSEYFYYLLKMPFGKNIIYR